MISILIPAKSEEFLQQTIDDVFNHAEGDVEVLVALDNWKNAPNILATDVIHTNLGQRGATNRLAELATGEYVMKLDAHCSMSQGFDIELIKAIKDATVAVPALCNLYAYDWVCEKGHRTQCEQFEDVKECPQCKGKVWKETVWQPIQRPIMTNYCFDTNLHFQYCEKQSDKLETETMSIQGSCFLIRKKDYFDLNICDEKFGSWGQQGTEVALKAWLSGGKVISTRNAYYAHWFRGRKPAKTEDIMKTQKLSKNMFLNNKWDGQIRSLQSLIEQFSFPGDWNSGIMNKICKPF